MLAVEAFVAEVLVHTVKLPVVLPLLEKVMLEGVTVATFMLEEVAATVTEEEGHEDNITGITRHPPAKKE